MKLFFIWLHVMLLDADGNILSHSMMLAPDQPYPSYEICEVFKEEVVEEQRKLLGDENFVIKATCKPGYRISV